MLSCKVNMFLLKINIIICVIIPDSCLFNKNDKFSFQIKKVIWFYPLHKMTINANSSKVKANEISKINFKKGIGQK